VATTRHDGASNPSPVMLEGNRIGVELPQHCQGFVVDKKGTVVTCWHVCAAYNPLWVNLGSRGGFVADGVLAEDPVADVIVLHVAGLPEDMPFCTLSQERPVRGDACSILTVNSSGATVPVPGVFAREGDLALSPQYELNAVAIPGHSGSPVVNTGGQVIGLLFGSRNSDASCCPSMIIKRLLTEGDSAKPIPMATWRKRTFGEDSEYTAQLMMQSVDAYRSRDWQKCLDDGRQSLAKFPAQPVLLNYLCGALYEAPHRESDVSDWLKFQIKTLGESWVAEYRLGESLLRQKQYPDAESAFRRAIELKQSRAARYYLAQTLDRSNRSQEAFDVLKESVRLWPDHTASWTLLASIAIARGDFQTVYDVYRALIRENPRNPEWLVAFGRLGSMRGDSAVVDELRGQTAKFGPFWQTRFDMAISAARNSAAAQSAPSNANPTAPSPVKTGD